MKIALMVLSSLVIFTSLSQASENCGKIESINVKKSSVILKTGEELIVRDGAHTIATLTTALANDLTICITPYNPSGNGNLISISK